jgi:hypothetical protein
MSGARVRSSGAVLLGGAMSDWPFADPPNVATVTTVQVVRDGEPILLVYHDEDDGAWQFLTATATNSMKNMMMVSLKSIVTRDPTVVELADLPLGWHAWREHIGAPWVREKQKGGGAA